MQARVRLPEFSFPRGALVDTAAGEIPLNSLGPARKPLHAVGAARGSGVCEDGGEQAEILRSTQQAVGRAGCRVPSGFLPPKLCPMRPIECQQLKQRLPPLARRTL